MSITSARQELILAGDSRATASRPASMLDSVQRALRAVAPSGSSLDRVTLMAAESDAVLWLRADYSSTPPHAAQSVTLDAPSSPSAALPVPALVSWRGPAPRAAADRTLPYARTLDASYALPKGTLVDVLA